MTASRFLLPAGALALMGLISKGVASDATRRDRVGVEPATDSSTRALPAIAAPTAELASSDDDSAGTDDDLDDDTAVP